MIIIIILNIVIITLLKCGAINNCHINNKCFELKLHIYNDSNKKDFYRLPNNLNISINNARIVEGLPYDIIIGLPTVRK